MSRRLVKAVLLLVLGLSAHALSQFAADPFFERPESLRHAFALSLMEARLTAIEGLLATGGEEDEAGEVISELAEDLAEGDLPLLAGSLEAEDSELLARLEEALDELSAALSPGAGDTVGGGAEGAADDDADVGGDDDVTSDVNADVGERVSGVRSLIDEVRAALVPDALTDRGLVAGTISLLLLSEQGVAEAYEEAVAEDPDEYPLGWAEVQGVRELWAVLAAEADDKLRGDVEDALAELDELFSKPLPAGELRGDPEDAEEPSHRIVALLERISDARLYPDRDLGVLAGHALSQARQGCEDLAAGRQLMGNERLLAAEVSYEYLADLAGLLAPETHAKVEESLEVLAEEGEPQAAERCPELLEALDELRTVTGG